jgi:SAM-dependent methyltransferase
VLSGAFATVVAANVVDLLDDPATFLDEVALALRPGGRFVCTTPDPALGVSHGSDEALVDLIEAAGLRIVSDEDDLPWLRVHGPRHVQVYAVRKVVAAR